MILKNVNQNPQGLVDSSRSAVMAVMAEKEASAQRCKDITLAHRRNGAGNRYLRLPEVRQLVPLSPATIWRKSRNGTRDVIGDAPYDCFGLGFGPLYSKVELPAPDVEVGLQTEAVSHTSCSRVVFTSGAEQLISLPEEQALSPRRTAAVQHHITSRSIVPTPLD